MWLNRLQWSAWPWPQKVTVTLCLPVLQQGSLETWSYTRFCQNHPQQAAAAQSPHFSTLLQYHLLFTHNWLIPEWNTMKRNMTRPRNIRWEPRKSCGSLRKWPCEAAGKCLRHTQRPGEFLSSPKASQCPDLTAGLGQSLQPGPAVGRSGFLTNGGLAWSQQQISPSTWAGWNTQVEMDHVTSNPGGNELTENPGCLDTAIIFP